MNIIQVHHLSSLTTLRFMMKSKLKHFLNMDKNKSLIKSLPLNNIHLKNQLGMEVLSQRLKEFN